MQDFILGFQGLFSDPFNIVIFVGALLGGLIFGAIPGLNGVVLATILLPFTGYLDPTQAIMMLAVIYVSGVYGGAVTAILFNIPGSPENAPTAFDGYPMTKNGQASKAIGAAVICSAVGGAASATGGLARYPASVTRPDAISTSTDQRRSAGASALTRRRGERWRGASTPGWRPRPGCRDRSRGTSPPPSARR